MPFDRHTLTTTRGAEPQLVTLSSSVWAIGGYSHGTTFIKSIEKWNAGIEDWESVSFSMMEGRANH